MSNASVLREGAKKARKLIREHIRQCMNNALEDIVSDQHNRMAKLPGMTGNTRTSPAGATYVDGVFDNVQLAGHTCGAPPIRTKLRKGGVFPAGAIRYDGDVQERKFTAGVDTTGETSQQDNYNFLESQQSGSGFKMTVVGATEYLGNDQVVESYSYAQTALPKHLKPLSE